MAQAEKGDRVPGVEEQIQVICHLRTLKVAFHHPFSP